MRAVVQRVAEAQVRIGGEVVAQIGAGLAVLLGVGRGDGEADALYLAEKTLQLRVFPDPGGEMNLSVSDVGGAVLAVSQFTLYGDARRGRRPSYIEAARPEQARPPAILPPYPVDPSNAFIRGGPWGLPAARDLQSLQLLPKRVA